MEESIILPLKMLNKHLPNFSWSVSFPVGAVSFWHLGVSFCKNKSCEELSPLMAYQFIAARSATAAKAFYTFGYESQYF